MIKRICITLIFVCCFIMPNVSFGGVSPEEASKLKSTLTPLGAEKAGNADGTIPAWEGGYTTVPAGYKSGDPRPDPFADEKPMFSITSKNMSQYADKLSESVKALLNKYPDYRLDVYPTHRTAAAPDYVYENTFKNATRTRTTNNGLSIEGAYGGIPFPIPKDGYEAMWNHLLAWQGEAYDYHMQSWGIDRTGTPVLAGEMDISHQHPYYYSDGTLEDFNGYYWETINIATAPPVRAGEAVLLKDPVDQYGLGRQVWQYLIGQRRVRRAPAIAYDTPNSMVSGFDNWDEVFTFIGALDRYEWKLLGKKEMYVVYNNNGFMLHDMKEILGPHYPNPDLVRWELHRVWVVDATLAPGKRHVVPHRRFYLDEDTWASMLADGWDGQGQLWKCYVSLPFIKPEFPAIERSTFFIINLLTSEWVMENTYNNFPGEQVKKVQRRSEKYYSPSNLGAVGVR